MFTEHLENVKKEKEKNPAVLMYLYPLIFPYIKCMFLKNYHHHLITHYEPLHIIKHLSAQCNFNNCIIFHRMTMP